MKALLFDCDGVLVDTERDGHRVAFNKAFQYVGIDAEWGIEEYKELLKVAGGKERMKHYFDQKGWPAGFEEKDQLIKDLHKKKTDIFMDLIESGALPLRPGIARIVDEAIEAGLKLAVCSTSNERAVTAIVRTLLGMDRYNKFDGIFAGDIVKKKKPDPEIYLLALKNLKVRPEECMVIEDSRNGLLAAKAAGMKCIITTNPYTEDEAFPEADGIYPLLGDDPDIRVNINQLMKQF